MAATALAGAALGVAVEVGATLMLFSGAGFLTAAGFLIAAALAALAVGLWAGAPEEGESPRALARARWTFAIAVLVLAAIYAPVWSRMPGLRIMAVGRILGVLLLLAEPAYAIGSLLRLLDIRRPTPGSGAAVPAVLGAALGVLATAGVLIPHVAAGTVLASTAGVLALAGIWETRNDNATLGRRAMDGKVAIVTGVGGRGQVGFAVAQALLERGAAVVAVGHSAAIEDNARELAETGRPVLALQADLTVAEDAERVAAGAREHFGRVDLLVNVAGGLSVIKPLAETDAAEWDREMERNAKTTFLATRAVLPLLRESGGAIVNFASPAALRARASLGAYSAAKAAVVALTRATALEEAPHGVRANAIAPGMVDTEQNRQSVRDPERTRWVTREQIVDVVLFLAGAASSGISGETIHVLGEGVG